MGVWAHHGRLPAHPSADAFVGTLVLLAGLPLPRRRTVWCGGRAAAAAARGVGRLAAATTTTTIASALVATVTTTMTATVTTTTTATARSFLKR